MSSSKDLEAALSAGKSLDDYKKALEKSVKNFTKNDLPNYIRYYDIICKSKIPLKAKKSLILALQNTGIPIKGRWDSPWPLITAMTNRDLPLLVFLTKKAQMKFNNDYSIRRECIKLGGNPEENQFTINMLNKVLTTLTMQKKFLAGAIENGNTVLIKYIVEVLKPDLHIPTSQRSSSHALASSFAQSGDVELLKYFEEHGYNIHECQRDLLDQCYRFKKKTKAMRAYILNDQANSSASDIYNEKIANRAFNEGDTETLQKFGKIGMAVYWNQVINILKQQREFIIFKVAIDRFLERETANHVRYNRTWKKDNENGNWRILAEYHINQVWKIAKNRQDVWDYFKQLLQKNASNFAIRYADKKDGTEKNNTEDEN
jgi:hypothetical protein